MVLFKKLFANRNRQTDWQQGDTEQRTNYLNSLTDDSSRLAFIAAESSESLKVLAVTALQNTESLEALLSDSNTAVRQAARTARLQQLLPDTSALRNITDTSVLTSIAALTDNDEQRLAAIRQIKDEATLFSIAREHPVARVRSVAAEGITSAEQLQQLLTFAQGKDKSLYRLCKDKLAAQRELQKQQQQRLQAVEQLEAQLAYLNRIGYHPEFHGKLQVLRQQWQQLASEASAAQQSTVDNAFTLAQATLDAHAQEEARLQAQREQQQAASAQQQSIVEQLQALLNEAEAQITDLPQQLQTFDDQWRTTLPLNKPDADTSRHYENIWQQLQTLSTAAAKWQALSTDVEAFLQQAPAADSDKQLQQCNQWLKQISWPATLPMPENLQCLQQRQQQLQAEQQQASANEGEILRQLDVHLDALDQAISEGHLRDANKQVKQIINALKRCSGHKAQAQQRRFRAMESRLNEIRDWAGFAETPKKESLVASMQALIGADIAPDVLADKIHQLQDEWKSLSNSHNDQALWEQFRTAADQAFEPCREHFAAVASLREQNKALRQRLIQELTDYDAAMDWQQADWKVVQKTLNAARESFRQYSPVDHASHRDTSAEFRTVCDRIYAHLQAEYDRNIAARQALVDEALAVSTADDLSGAADAVKTLQMRWKEIGMVPRAADQKLWKAFRKACDTVFARLDEQRNARKAEVNSVVQSAEALIAKAAEAMQSPDAASVLAETRTAFNELSLPRAAHQRLLRELNQMDEQLQTEKQQQRRQQQLTRWENLFSLLKGEAAESSNLPSGYTSTELNASLTASDDDALTLCIGMEILADIESPDSDKALRMNLQVQRLAQGMGMNISRDDERKTLIYQWHNSCHGHPLTERFISAINASL